MRGAAALPQGIGRFAERLGDRLNSAARSPTLPARVAFAVTAVLVVAIAWVLADAAWFFTTGTAPTPRADRPAPRAATPNKGYAADLPRVAGLNLFGAPVAAPTPAQAAEAAQPTTLPLQLLGVVVAAVPSESTAVIAEPSRDGALFTVNDAVPGNALLAEVHADHVVLRRGERLEKLFFPRFDDAAADAGFGNLPEVDPMIGITEYPSPDAAVETAEAVPPPEPVPVDIEPPQASNNAPVANASLASLGERARNEPTNLLTEIGMHSIGNGAAQGYRVGDSVSNNLARVGLQPGDVVLTVNGRPVGDVQADQRQVDSVMAQGSARLEIQRGNRRFFVTASLK